MKEEIPCIPRDTRNGSIAPDAWLGQSWSSSVNIFQEIVEYLSYIFKIMSNYSKTNLIFVGLRLETSTL